MRLALATLLVACILPTTPTVVAADAPTPTVSLSIEASCQIAQAWEEGRCAKGDEQAREFVLGWEPNERRSQVHHVLLRISPPDAQIEASAHILGATLRLRRTALTPAPSVVRAARLTRPWGTAASWHAPGTSGRWTTPGGDAEDVRRAVALPGDIGSVVELDVTAAVVAWMDEYRRAAGTPNHGLLLRQGPVPSARCEYDGGGGAVQPGDIGCASGLAAYAGPGHPDLSLRPELIVRYARSVGAGPQITLPGAGAEVDRWVLLQARADRSSVTAVRFRYALGDGPDWSWIPTDTLTDRDGGPLLTEWIPIMPASDYHSQPVLWNVPAAVGPEYRGLVRVRAVLEDPHGGGGGATEEVGFRLGGGVDVDIASGGDNSAMHVSEAAGCVTHRCRVRQSFRRCRASRARPRPRRQTTPRSWCLRQAVSRRAAPPG